MKDTGKAYHTSCSGLALQTAQAHAEADNLTLFGSCFCPFVHRVWIALEYLKIPYQYYEVDPYRKPKDLLEVSPKGLVPALRLNNYSPPKPLNESTVILAYLEDLSDGVSVNHAHQRHLLPALSDPYARALARLEADHINRTLVPVFYRYLQAQDSADQITHGKAFLAAIEKLIELFEKHEGTVQPGLWAGEELGWADVMAVPWLFRATNVLVHYRGFSLPTSNKFKAYLERLLQHPDVQKTCSTEQLYLDSYERYAANRPHTSQVANAINSGQELP
ncbi:glutathione S-transferase [Gautieria morchelliformis]|nr:glutathione S-transferase [Gautieria morchelliformis]